MEKYQGLCKIHVTGIMCFCAFVCLLELACRFSRFSRFSHIKANRKALVLENGYSEYVVGCFRLIWIVVDFKKIDKKRYLDRPP